jgi:ABC-type dipeptide/oligopeptide/nickel transport system permease component
MRTFITKRIATLVIQVLAVISVFFVVLRLMPANPAAQAASAGGAAAIRHEEIALGLNTSIPTQLWQFLSHMVQGNLGTSWADQSPVWTDLVNRFPLTLTVVVMAFVVALAVAIPLGRAAASRPNGRVDRGTMLYSLVAGAQPDFFWGLLLVYLLAIKTQIFPVPTGVLSANIANPPTITHFLVIDALISGHFATFVNAMWHLALPVITLAFILTGPLTKMTRESVMTVVSADYVLYARAAGLPERQVRRMMLRNAIAPVLTLTGILFAYMFGGAVLIEYVFSLNGIGLYALNSTLSLDYPAVQGAVLVLTTLSLLIFVALDVVHALVDPRVRLGGD